MRTVPKSILRESATFKSRAPFYQKLGTELSTLLAAIIGELDSALTQENKESSQKSTQIALKAAETALGLIRNFRYFTTHPEKESPSEKPLIDLSQVVLDSVELIEKELEISHIEIKVAAEAMTFASIEHDIYQHVVLNLLSQSKNNIGKEGKIFLSLKKCNSEIILKCQDNGKNPLGNHSSLNAIQSLSLAYCRELTEAYQAKWEQFHSEEEGNVTLVTLPASKNEPEIFQDQRRFRRVKVTLPMAFQLSKDKTWVKTELDTLSFGGCFALMGETKQSFPEFNETVSLRIHHFGEEVIEIPKARIASVFVSGDKAGMGIEFLELSQHHQKLLEAILKGHTG